MKKTNGTVVIAIASVSGGGKTTVVRQLAQTLPKAKALYFDAYEFDGPPDILKWVDEGNDYNEWNLAPLIKDIETVLEEPLDFILLDFPFAYQHTQSSKFIDQTIFIDTPLDIALTRRMARDFSECPAHEILLYMEHYAAHGRRGYLEMLQTIKPDSDIVIDGALSVSEIVNQVAEVIKG